MRRLTIRYRNCHSSLTVAAPRKIIFVADKTLHRTESRQLSPQAGDANFRFVLAAKAATVFAGANVAGDSVMKMTLGLAVAMGVWLGAANAATNTVTYTYDSQGRLATAVYVSGTTTRTVTYNYDAAGNRTTVVTN
jgi:hypothetical protein